MEILLHYLFSDGGMTVTGHALLFLAVLALYRRVEKLEKQLISIAISTGKMAALFEYDHPIIPPSEIDGREP